MKRTYSDYIPITHPIVQEYITKCFLDMIDIWRKLELEGKIGPPTYAQPVNMKTTI